MTPERLTELKRSSDIISYPRISASEFIQLLTAAESAEELRSENERLTKLVGTAMQAIKHVPQTVDSQGDPGSFNGCLWGRVARLFGLGSTSAIELCREFDEDPHWQPDETESVYREIDPSTEGA